LQYGPTGQSNNHLFIRQVAALATPDLGPIFPGYDVDVYIGVELGLL